MSLISTFFLHTKHNSVGVFVDGEKGKHTQVRLGESEKRARDCERGAGAGEEGGDRGELKS